MTTKLTLSVEKNIVTQAKDYARKSGRSLSDIIEKYLADLIEAEDTGAKGLSAKLRRIKGAVKLPKNFDEKQELRSYLENKHL